jgi:hypothetical protein
VNKPQSTGPAAVLVTVAAGLLSGGLADVDDQTSWSSILHPVELAQLYKSSSAVHSLAPAAAHVAAATLCVTERVQSKLLDATAQNASTVPPRLGSAGPKNPGRRGFSASEQHRTSWSSDAGAQ